MTKINLRKYYPLYYKEDCYIEVSDEVAEQLAQSVKHDEAYRIRTMRHKAYFSLDVGDGIENEILLTHVSPVELYERKITHEELYSAMSKLPEKQAKRIYAYYFQNLSMTELAKIEGVSVQAIQQTIGKGLFRIAEIIKNFLIPQNSKCISQSYKRIAPTITST